MEAKFAGIPIFVVLLVISVPIHELCHFLCIKAMGCNDNLKIKFFYVHLSIKERRFGFGGFVSTDDGIFEFPGRFDIHYKLIAFLTGLSGGVGAAAVMSLGFLVLFLLPQAGSYFWKILLIVIVLQAIYGVKEGVSLYKTAELV